MFLQEISFGEAMTDCLGLQLHSPVLPNRMVSAANFIDIGKVQNDSRVNDTYVTIYQRSAVSLVVTVAV